MEKIIALLLAIISIFSGFIFGKNDNTKPAEEATTTEQLQTLPSINTVSSSNLKEYSNCFNPVSSAKLVTKKGKSEISPSDERLIRLLNYISYSEEKNVSFWSQGELSETTGFIEETYLEVNFSNVTHTGPGIHSLKSFDKAIISGGNVILVQTNSEYSIYGTTCRMLMQPYMSILIENETTIDLLKIASIV